jgi:adenosine deaminase
MGQEDFIAGLPKAELHVHHVGSASPATVAALACRHVGTTAVPNDPEALARYFTFTDFGHFIEVYQSVVALLRTAEDIHTLTAQVAADLAAQNVRYAELTLTPYTSVHLGGIPPGDYVAAVEDVRSQAERDLGLVLRWCVDIPGEYGVPAADATLDFVRRFRPDGLVSFGLGGPEAGVGRSQFAPHFAQARAEGLHSVPHAGESTGPQTVWEAVRELGAERIGHGIAAARDPQLLSYLADHAIALEVSPTSNVCTQCVPELAEHPLSQLVAAGVPVSINSDDPPMFSTTLNHEYAVAARLLGLDDAGVADLARSAVRQSFAPDPVKAAVLAEIDRYCLGVGAAH